MGSPSNETEYWRDKVLEEKDGPFIVHLLSWMGL